MFAPFFFSTFALSALNHAPVLTVSSNSEPTVLNYGELVELPIQATDADGDRLTLYYKFDDDHTWHQAPSGVPFNTLPGYVFAQLDPETDHTLHVLASDGTLDSQPRSFGIRPWYKRFGCRIKKSTYNVVKIFKKPPSSGLNFAKPALSPPPPTDPPPGDRPPRDDYPRELAIPNMIQSLRGNSVAVSYSFDDSDVFSTPVNYPLGEFEVMISGPELAAHVGPGDHKITFRYEEAGDRVTQDEWAYQVNSRPDIEVSSSQPLSLKGVPVAPVSLPLQVSDADGDEVSLWYRFDGQGDWVYVPAGLGVNVLPAEAFAGRTSGFVEIAAWDGYEHSEGRVRIGYAIEASEADNVGDDAFFGGLSPAAFAGIVIGVVALIALAAAIIVVATRRKKESSSTGLIESD